MCCVVGMVNIVFVMDYFGKIMDSIEEVFRFVEEMV